MGGETRTESLVGGHAGHLLVLVSVGWFTIQGGRLLLPPLLPELIDSLAITPAAAGVALSTLWGTYALLQYPSGRLSDRLSRRTLLVTALGIAAGGFALLAGVGTYPLLLVAVAVVGVGAGLYPTATRALLSDHFEERRGAAFGLHTASGDLGGVAAAGVAVVVIAVASWRAAFLPVAVVLVAVAAGLHAVSREPYVVRRVDLDVRGAVRRLAGDATGRRVLVGYCGYAFAWQATTSFLPTFLRRAKGLSPSLAGVGFAGLFVVGAVVKPVSGRLGDRYGKVRVAVATTALATGSLVALVGATSRPAVLAATVGYAAGLLSYPPVVQSFLMDAFPDDSMGADLGLLRTVYVGVGALGPTYVGVVVGTAGYEVAYATIVVPLVGTGVALAWAARDG